MKNNMNRRDKVSIALSNEAQLALLARVPLPSLHHRKAVRLTAPLRYQTPETL
jgi:hypothetical protein